LSDQEAFKQYLIEEFIEDYEHRRVSRRDTLKLLAGVTGSMTMAGALVAACSPAPAPTPAPAPSATPKPANTPVPEDQRVAENDPAVRAQDVTFASGSDTIMGYLARPAAGDGPFPMVLMCHENRGLTEYGRDVTRRLAKSGYVGLAVDLTARAGGTAKLDPTAVPGIISNGGTERHVSDFQAALAYGKTQSFVNKDRVGMIGFCLGGGVTWLMASRTPELKAIAPFYGPAPADPKVLSNIKAAVLAVYGGLDERTNSRIPDVEAALKEGKVTYQVKVYPNSTHAFHNDRRENASLGLDYNAVAARQAWADTMAHFDKYLKT
jgi:carboxymethylenebutenolidase